MKVGITGGMGFIGKWVMDECLVRGHSVLILDHKKRPPEYYEDNRRVDYMWGDVRDDTVMLELAAHVDGIIHLAAVLGTQETIQDPRPAADTNVVGGLNFLQAISRYDQPGVYICVGNHWMNNPYSISKTTIERFCHMYRDERGTKINQVRAVNAYGPRQMAAPPFAPGQVRKIVPAFACRALSGMDVEVYGDGNQISDMVWVGDLAFTLVEALEHAGRGNVLDHVVECGPSVSHTVAEVAQMVIDSAVALGHTPVGIKNLPMRPGEVPGAKVSADADTLSLVGVDPYHFTDLRPGLRRTVEWFAENEGVTWKRPEI